MNTKKRISKPNDDRSPIHPSEKTDQYPVLEDEVKHYLSRRHRKVESSQLSERTYTTDRRSLELFVEWIDERCDALSLDELNEVHLRQFKDFRLESVSPTTLGKELRHIQSFLGDLVRREVLDSNPMKSVGIPEPGQRNEVPNQREFEGLKSWLSDQIESRKHPEWIHLLMQLACHTGMRLGELIQIKWERGPEDHGTGHARSYVYLNAQEKTLTIKFKRKVRRIPVTHVWSVFQHLADRKEDEEIYVFSSPQGGHYDDSYVCRRWKEQVRKVDQLKRPYTCHSIRHAVVTSLMRKGYSDRKIGKMVGHSSAQITDRYSHLVANDLDDMVDELSME